MKLFLFVLFFFAISELQAQGARVRKCNHNEIIVETLPSNDSCDFKSIRRELSNKTRYETFGQVPRGECRDLELVPGYPNRYITPLDSFGGETAGTTTHYTRASCRGEPGCQRNIYALPWTTDSDMTVTRNRATDEISIQIESDEWQCKKNPGPVNGDTCIPADDMRTYSRLRHFVFLRFKSRHALNREQVLARLTQPRTLALHSSPEYPDSACPSSNPTPTRCSNVRSFSPRIFKFQKKNIFDADSFHPDAIDNPNIRGLNIECLPEDDCMAIYVPSNTNGGKGYVILRRGNVDSLILNVRPNRLNISRTKIYDEDQTRNLNSHLRSCATDNKLYPGTNGQRFNRDLSVPPSQSESRQGNQ